MDKSILKGAKESHEKKMTLLPEDQVNAKFAKLEREIKGIKEEQTKLWKHQKEIEDKIKGKLG